LSTWKIKKPIKFIKKYLGEEMVEKNLHITKHGKNWNIVEENKPKPVKTLDTQKEAIDIARNILKNGDGGELFIHSATGGFRERDTISPAHDPESSKG
jgi:hypothetical protein